MVVQPRRSFAQTRWPSFLRGKRHHFR
jgi:hypothetical protein